MSCRVAGAGRFIMSSFNLEKWSLDVATDQGDVLCAELTSFRFAGMGRAVIAAGVWTADGREVRDSQATGLPVVGPAGRVDVRGYSLEPARDGFRVSLDLPRIGLDLLCASGGEWRPNGNGVLLTRGTGIFRWTVPRFRASVSGSLAFDSGKFDVRGRGCLEAVRTDVPPWRLRLAGIFQGRAHFPTSTLIFHQLATGEGAVIQHVLVKRDSEPGPPHRTEAALFPPRCGAGSQPPRLCWVDDYHFQVDHEGHAGKTTLLHPAFTLSLTEKRVLEGGAGPPPRGIRPASPWKYMDCLYGRTERRKVLSEARLIMGGDEERGLAVHEQVVWRRGFKS